MRRGWAYAISLMLVASTAITGCSGTKKKEEADKPSPYAAGNYPGTLKIGTPYDIDGRTYVPNHDPDYVEEGMASWYGPGFHGRSTANGERFDQNALTAAHRTLPMPSMVRVTNLENGITVDLKVNDRGPFKKDRIIDLSKAAAEKLGVIGKGTARVRVEYLPKETKMLIADLIKNNQLQATNDTLTMLAMNDVVEEQVVSDAAPSAASMGFGFISSANAAEPVYNAPQNGVVERAPLAPVASRSLEPPRQQEEMQLARLEREAAPQKPSPYNENGVVPSVMPLDGEVTSEPIAKATDTLPPPPAAEPEAPADLQPLPDNASGDAPLYAPLEAPAMPVPQSRMPNDKNEVVVASTTPTGTPSGIFIQAGSFSQAQNAHDFSQRLAPVGRTVVKPVEISGRTWYRVQVGPLANMSTAHSALQNLEGMGIHDARVVKD